VRYFRQDGREMERVYGIYDGELDWRDVPVSEIKIHRKTIRCDECGQFVKYADIESGTAIFEEVVPDNSFLLGYWRTKCAKCAKRYREHEGFLKCPICGKFVPDAVSGMDAFTHRYYPETYHEPIETSDMYELGKQVAKKVIEDLRKVKSVEDMKSE
jgi:hypothetical protein